jgi:hypothetical protein
MDRQVQKKGIQGQMIWYAHYSSRSSNPILPPAAIFPSPRARPIEPDGKRKRRHSLLLLLRFKKSAKTPPKSSGELFDSTYSSFWKIAAVNYG